MYTQTITAARQRENNSTEREQEMTALTRDPTETGHHRQITVSQSVENHSQMFVLYMNARSLLPKMDELLAYVVTEKPDVIAVTETWIKPDYLISEFSIPRYESFHKSRAHKKGGGVIGYIKNTLTSVKVEKQDAEKYDTVYVDITTERNRKLTFGTVYRPPKLQAADDTALYEEINLITRNKDAIIIGDFNCPNVDNTTIILSFS